MATKKIDLLNIVENIIDLDPKMRFTAIIDTKGEILVHSKHSRIGEFVEIGQLQDETVKCSLGDHDDYICFNSCKLSL